MPRFEQNIYAIIERAIHPYHHEFTIPNGSQNYIDYFNIGLNEIKNTGLFSHCHTQIIYTTRAVNNKKLVDLIWSYVDIESLGGTDSDYIKGRLQYMINKLNKKTYTINDCFLVSLAQKKV